MFPLISSSFFLINICLLFQLTARETAELSDFLPVVICFFKYFLLQKFKKRNKAATELSVKVFSKSLSGYTTTLFPSPPILSPHTHLPCKYSTGVRRACTWRGSLSHQTFTLSLSLFLLCDGFKVPPSVPLPVNWGVVDGTELFPVLWSQQRTCHQSGK